MKFTHLLLFAILIFSSCTKENDTSVLDAQDLKLIHANVKAELHKSFSIENKEKIPQV